jgi:molybdopterin biosynthesis enzyme
MVNFEMFVKPTILKLSGTKNFYHPLIYTKIAKDYQFKAGKTAVILGKWNGASFTPISNQKPGMVAPIGQADGMIVVTKEIGQLEKDKMVKMIPIKIDLQSGKQEDFFIRD